MITIETYRASIRRFYNRLRHFASTKNVVSLRIANFNTILLFLLFSLLYFPILLHALFTLFILVTIDVVYVNSMRFKHIYSLCHFLGLNYKRLNLNFLILKQLLIDGDIESNPGPTQNVCKSPVGRTKKITCLKEQQKSMILVKTILMLLVFQRNKIVF